MTIINAQLGFTGNPDAPKILFLDTNNTLAEVQATGFLNNLQAQGYGLSEKDIALVVTKATEDATSAETVWLDISVSGQNWSLIAPVNPVTLALNSAQIFVGNASNVAQARTMSGDATLSNTGVLTIANNAITTVKILDANVTLAKLAAGIAPSHVIKFAAQYTTTGGAASEAITVTGAAATDLAFVQMVDDGTANVTIVDAVVTLNTLTVTFSADPGNDAIINYQIIRAAV